LRGANFAGGKGKESDALKKKKKVVLGGTGGGKRVGAFGGKGENEKRDDGEGEKTQPEGEKRYEAKEKVASSYLAKRAKRKRDEVWGKRRGHRSGRGKRQQDNFSIGERQTVDRKRGLARDPGSRSGKRGKKGKKGGRICMSIKQGNVT